MQNWVPWVAAAVLLYWFMKPSVPADARLTPEGVREALKEGGVQVVDVRTPGEYQSGHMQGAKSIPLNELQSRLGELDKARPVIAVCASGARSAAALKLLRSAGFGQSKHLEGGLSRWVASGFAVQR